MKPPAYTPREMDALRHADRIVVRRWFAPSSLGDSGRWEERTLWPEEGESVAQTLGRVQKALAQIVSSDDLLLYVGGLVNGEVALAHAPRRAPCLRATS
jgi:hypothetical protein